MAGFRIGGSGRGVKMTQNRGGPGRKPRTPGVKTGGKTGFVAGNAATSITEYRGVHQIPGKELYSGNRNCLSIIYCFISFCLVMSIPVSY